jgi:hypothetical protein
MEKCSQTQQGESIKAQLFKSISAFILFGLVLAACGAGMPFSPQPTATPSSTPTLIPTSTMTPTLTVTLTPTDTLTPTETFTPTFAAFKTLNVNDFGWYTVYWNKMLWQSALSAAKESEDFEGDQASYGELSFPYLTSHGFLLDCGQCSAQIFKDPTLLASGNQLHFRSWGSGMQFSFPNDTPVSAFGFDFVSNEKWQLIFEGMTVDLPVGRSGFVGVIFSQTDPDEFTLASMANAQGGISMDNITFINSESENTPTPTP